MTRESATDGNGSGNGADEESEPRTPDEMSLDELREEIQTIDREIVELIAQRTYVADTIAQVKEEQGLPTTDEKQEQQVMERAGENAEQFDVDANLVKAIFRLLIELNKIEQNHHIRSENDTQWEDE
ncbi:chorismate mutase [Halopiger xanaduensis]|uniref:Chorismate mutase n=1 Tax=Halopiger xanaduensis (strain DSM 18323 / JCM 14033 / SH-6) TaxID=797210 RepID=F8D5A3_HALXS|nr:chorismate mutase [Halopiger xanaduensis]AEH37602.1 chorismate mutase [Halopiger xanaduensis SH-6]